MKLRDKVAGFLFGGSFEEDSHTYLEAGPTRGLLMIAPELEEFASCLLARGTAAAKERRKLLEERTGAPPAGGQKT